MLLNLPAGCERRNKKFKEGVHNGEDDSSQLCLPESSSAGAVAPRADGHRQSSGNAMHLGAPKSFGFAEKKKKKRSAAFYRSFFGNGGRGNITNTSEVRGRSVLKWRPFIKAKKKVGSYLASRLDDGVALLGLGLHHTAPK